MPSINVLVAVHKTRPDKFADILERFHSMVLALSECSSEIKHYLVEQGKMRDLDNAVQKLASFITEYLERLESGEKIAVLRNERMRANVVLEEKRGLRPPEKSMAEIEAEIEQCGGRIL